MAHTHPQHWRLRFRLGDGRQPVASSGLGREDDDFVNLVEGAAGEVEVMGSESLRELATKQAAMQCMYADAHLDVIADLASLFAHDKRLVWFLFFLIDTLRAEAYV